MNTYDTTLMILGHKSDLIQESDHHLHQLVEDVKRQDGVNQDVDALASQYTNVPRPRLCIGHFINVAIQTIQIQQRNTLVNHL